MIYKAFTGKHLDLTKIISISDAWLNHEYVATFTIQAQLLETPLVYRRRVKTLWDPEKNKSHYLLLSPEGEEVAGPTEWYQIMYGEAREFPGHKVLTLARLQDHINELVAIWAASKGQFTPLVRAEVIRYYEDWRGKFPVAQPDWDELEPHARQTFINTWLNLKIEESYTRPPETGREHDLPW